MSSFSFGRGPVSTPMTAATGMGPMTFMNRPPAQFSSHTTTPQPSQPASFATHPFQYMQECLDPRSANYRFRVGPSAACVKSSNSPIICSSSSIMLYLEESSQTRKAVHTTSQTVCGHKS